MKQAVLVFFMTMSVVGSIQAAELTAQEAEQRLLAYGTIPTEEFRQLLAIEGVHVDAANRHQITLLMQQIMRRKTGNDMQKPIHLQNMQLLLDHGASLNATSFNGYTPFTWAAENEDTEATKLLMNKLQEKDYDEAVATLAIRDGADRTAADLAKEKNNEEIVLLLTLPAHIKSAKKERA